MSHSNSSTPTWTTDSIIADYNTLTEGTNIQQLKKYLEPYSKEELVDLMMKLAQSDDNSCQSLLQKIKTDKKWCKLFVHGLPWTTTQETLYNVFSRFGQIQECVILKDRNGQSKGYGFINYNNATEAMNAINAGPQQIDGRMVGSDLAWKGRKNRGNGGAKDYSSQSHGSNGRGGGGNRGQSYPMAQQSHGAHRGGMGVSGNPLQARIVNTVTGGNGLGGPLAMRRLFVYSLLYTTDDATLHNQFSQYGELEEAVIIKDKTNDMKSKGYGFVIFKNVRDAQKALQQPHKMIDGRTVHCSLAIDGQNKGGHGGNDRGGGHQQHRGGHAGAAMAAAAAGHPGVGGSGLSALSGLIAQQQAQLAAHPTLNALNTILQAQQQQAALQSYADPYQNVLYQAALGGSAPNAASGAGAGTTQLLQQLLAQQQQLQLNALQHHPHPHGHGQVHHAGHHVIYPHGAGVYPHGAAGHPTVPTVPTAAYHHPLSPQQTGHIQPGHPTHVGTPLNVNGHLITPQVKPQMQQHYNDWYNGNRLKRTISEPTPLLATNRATIQTKGSKDDNKNVKDTTTVNDMPAIIDDDEDFNDIDDFITEIVNENKIESLPDLPPDGCGGKGNMKSNKKQLTPQKPKKKWTWTWIRSICYV
mmetsp:Transcript_10085/g.9094  ORF Transcript_10085/g.9094 Transcript_10085/m.9094 type:complete len:639 (+) Transcript_10085:358-2274(+)